MTRARAAAFAVVLAVAAGAPRFAQALGFGQANRQDGGQPGQFMQAAAGARPLSMGGAFSAIADDANAPFWNASGLAQLQRYDLVTYYSKLGDDASIGAGALAVPTRRFGTFGISAVSLRSGSFKRRDAQNRDLGSFNNKASAYLISQAFNLNTRFAAGYTFKAISEQIDSHRDTGYGADLGLMLRPHSLWQFGLAIQNVVRPELKLKSQTESYPTAVRFGSRFEARPRLTLAADVSLERDRSAELSLGTEWRVSGPLALRVGANDREFTAGMGVSAGDAGIDYAFGMPHADVARDELGDNHRISFHLRFGSNVMAGSYRDLSRRREEQRIEVVHAEVGVDNIQVLKNRMRTWDGKLDATTFSQVQAARRSLRELAFKDQVEALEAQAYITHFQGRLADSVRLFDRALEKQPDDGGLRRDTVLAHERERNHPNPGALAAAYDRLDADDRRRRETEAYAIARAAEETSVAGGAGSTKEPPVRATGKTDEPPQVAFLPIPAPPMTPQRPAIERPAAPPAAPAAPYNPVVEEPAAAPAAVPAVEEPAKKEQPAPMAEAPAPSVEASPVPPASADVREARHHFEEGDYVRSHLATKKILEANPNDREAARQAIITNSVVAAQASINEVNDQTVDVPALEQRVDQSLVLFDQGKGFYETKRPDDAEALLERSVQICPANFLARNLLKNIQEDRFNQRWEGILPRAATNPQS